MVRAGDGGSQFYDFRVSDLIAIGFGCIPDLAQAVSEERVRNLLPH